MRFKTLTGHEPYPHQIETYEALKKGESVILRAPTGSGKSEAVFVPFVDLRNKSLPNRIIYSHPMRALVKMIRGAMYDGN
ncbi:MAG: DEAD/DEAH box helicase [Nitrospirota bacterium]